MTILGLYVFLAVTGVCVVFLMVVAAVDISWQRRTSKRRRGGFIR